MEGTQDPMATPVNPDDPQGSQFLRYAVDLFNFGYYWESHVYFEALWNAHGRKGDIADFFKAMIKLGAAGVKDDLGQEKQVKEHLMRARELILGLGRIHFLGFNLQKIEEGIESRLTNKGERLVLRPEWK